MRLSLIGMSGSGKSTWSKNLAEHGFKWFCCDDRIIEKLHLELSRPDGSLIEIGEWMGFPFDAFYKERESKYLSHEIETLQEIFEYLERPPGKLESNIVIDTTGSVVYTGKATLARLRRNTTVVHLATPPEVHVQMLKAYLVNKRPVLWRDLFSRKTNETVEDALSRCYPKLLSARERLYKKHADITIDYNLFNRAGFGVDDLLKAVHSG